MRLFKFSSVALYLFSLQTLCASYPVIDNPQPASLEQKKQLHTVIEQARTVIAHLTEQEITNRFGSPQSIQTSIEENKYIGETENVFHVIRYNDYQFRIFRSSDSQYEFITHFSILSSNDGLRWGIQTGISEAQLRYLFGTPEFISDGMLVYEDAGEELSGLIAHVQNGKVIRLDFCFYYE